jgi:tRNA threonylcarbamoyladenosine modification (KEOPS) complex Cgi121 subunit
MEAPSFPCVSVRLPSPDNEAHVAAFLEQRQNQRWVLLGAHAVQGEAQLWTAWVQAVRHELRGSMVARSVDAEYIRYLAGTHHISEAFSRAGLRPGQEEAWILYLPHGDPVENSLGHLQPVAQSSPSFEKDLDLLVKGLNWTIESREMSCSIEGMNYLGIDGSAWPDSRIEEALIAHILMADDQSSSHR